MPNGRFVSYYRVSTKRQGRSGLGLEAQRIAVENYLKGGNWTVLEAYTEIESGRKNNRPQLAGAMEHCRLTGATLLIAKLDRLSRDAHFLFGLEKSGIEFICADMPHANKLTVGIMALVAQQEQEMISQRTKDALAAAKIRRAKAGQSPLGGYRGGPALDPAVGLKARQDAAAAFVTSLQPTVSRLRDDGLSLRGIAAELSARSILTPRGGVWTAKHVMRILH